MASTEQLSGDGQLAGRGCCWGKVVAVEVVAVVEVDGAATISTAEVARDRRMVILGYFPFCRCQCS